MKLLFVIGDISAYGGTERVTTEIATVFAEAGCEVSILSLFGPAKPWFDIPNTIQVTSAGLEEADSSARRAIAISRYLKKEALAARADAMILVDSILFFFCVPWYWRSPSKIICWEHFNLSTNHGTRVRELARFAAARLSDRVVVLTERDARAWRKKYRISDRVQSIWNPIPRFHESDQVATRSPNAPLVALAVGRLTMQKGFDLLLSAWARVGSAREGWMLRIVGDGEEADTLKLLAADLGIEDTVVFVGQVRDMAAEYVAADLFVMSSRWEGLPMTLLEAQHFGLASIATDCPTGPSEVLSGGSGHLVEPENPNALAEGLVLLMTQPEQRAVMSLKARQNAQHYQTEAVKLEWVSLFKSLGLV